jgi:PAS domain S-box-containing protein
MGHDMAGGAGPDEVRALAETVLDAAGVARLGLTVSYDDGAVLRHVYVSEAAAEILGYEAEELVGDPTELAFGSDGRARLAELLLRWRGGDMTPVIFETEARRKDGLHVPVEVALSAVTLTGEPAIVAFLRDIRERKAAEEALRRSETRFRQLIEAAPDAIGVVRDRRFVYVNPAYVRLLRRPFGAICGFAVSDFVHRDDREALDRRLDAIRAGAPPSMPHDARVTRPDGRIIFVELMGLVIDYDGQPAVLDFARDTTERRQMQAQLAFSDRMATLGMLAAGVAHEINNPLAYAMLNLNTLGRQMAPSGEGTAAEGAEGAAAKLIATAIEGLGRVASIVRDLLGFSAPTSVDRWPVEAESVVESAINVAMHAIRGRARIERRYAAVPPLKTDPARLGQILLNLLFNAAQSFDTADEGTNVLALEIASPGPEQVVITVADNGPGISPRDLERIFEPFYTTKPKGTGLGLSMCQTLIASLEGRIEVESVVGEGSKFVVWLPTRRSSA